MLSQQKPHDFSFLLLVLLWFGVVWCGVVWCGVVWFGLVMQYKIEELAGASSIEHILAKISHGGLYAFMAIMPASGIAMGYYGGKGLPFFTTTLPGVVKTDENKKSTGEIAKQVCYVNFTNRRRLLLT